MPDLPSPQKYPNTMTETVPSRMSDLVLLEITAWISYARIVQNSAAAEPKVRTWRTEEMIGFSLGFSLIPGIFAMISQSLEMDV